MKQIVHEMGSGKLRIADVPVPKLRHGGVLVRTTHSVISVGTERATLETGAKSLPGKALHRPELVRKALDTAAKEGIARAYAKVRSRLSEVRPLGYSAAGIVEAVGPGVEEFSIGDRVACAGAEYASHAEWNWVPKNLAARIPDGVSGESAAFSTLGAIALHGVRQAESGIGEWVGVLGLGVLGQLAVRILRAAGVNVVAVDLDPVRVRIARDGGAHAFPRTDPLEVAVRQLTGGRGLDAVLLTATAETADPIELAGTLARDRARVVALGAFPIEIPRAVYYEKELELKLSRSYGPGRYDPSYEEGGVDYPLGYVRWTEGRNLTAFLDFLASGAVRVEPLVTHRFPFARAEDAYELIMRGGRTEGLGVLLEYPTEDREEPRRIQVQTDGTLPRRAARAPTVGSVGDPVRIGLIGAGRFARGTLLPLLRGRGIDLRGVVTQRGTSARATAERFGFRYMASDPEELFGDPEIDAVIVATRHRSHATLAAKALRAGKAVLVEKPLALDEPSLDDVIDAAGSGPLLMVGFNRRFAPATRLLVQGLRGVTGGRVVHARVNAGNIDPGHWIHDPFEGGGRLVGEGCHFVDLVLHLAGSLPVEVHATALLGDDPDASLRDSAQVTLRCADGSIGSVVYTSKGHPGAGKERIEVFAGGVTGVIDDFRRADLFGPGRARRRWKGRQAKGHREELSAFIDAVAQRGPAPIPLAELEASSRAVLRARRSLEERRPLSL